MSSARFGWRDRLIVSVGALLIRALGSTWRIRRTGAVVERPPASSPMIFAFWHGEMLPILMAHRDQDIHVLISDHRDGEYIAQIVERFGCRTIRGSSSKNAARALLALVHALRKGKTIAITPDGPRGPRHAIAQGLLTASQKSGAPILALRAVPNAAWRLGSWDRFVIPKPFTRVELRYAPVWVADGLEDSTERYAALMRELNPNDP